MVLMCPACGCREGELGCEGCTHRDATQKGCKLESDDAAQCAVLRRQMKDEPVQATEHQGSHKE